MIIAWMESRPCLRIHVFWEGFHGVTHKYYMNFKSVRNANLWHINSEICEQFNAFIQCIKYTGTHVTQGHFCFFFAIHDFIMAAKENENIYQNMK